MKTMLLRFVSFAVPLFVTASVFAQETGGTNDNDVRMMSNVAAGFAIAVAAVGGAIGQAKASAAALEGIARNPSASDKLFTPMILGLALIESLVIYALVVAIMLMG